MDGSGSICFWGFSPSLDLLNGISNNAENNSEQNILIVGSGDFRHIIHTYSRYKRKCKENNNLNTLILNVRIKIKNKNFRFLN